jgi:hypothetical protein
MPTTSTATSPVFAYPPMVRVPTLHYDFEAEGAEKVREHDGVHDRAYECYACV